MAGEKAIIRKRVLHNRRLLSEDEFEQRNALVVEEALDFLISERIGCFHCFLPISRNKEINTWKIIQQAWRAGIQPVVSATDFERETMNHFYFNGGLRFVPDRFGIPTPVGGDAADLSQVSVVFMPLLAADKLGNRIGYGKGYYDRLLGNMPSSVLKIGLNLTSLFDAFPFNEAHDIRMNACITPQGIVWTEGN